MERVEFFTALYRVDVYVVILPGLCLRLRGLGDIPLLSDITVFDLFLLLDCLTSPFAVYFLVSQEFGLIETYSTSQVRSALR